VLVGFDSCSPSCELLEKFDERFEEGCKFSAYMAVTKFKNTIHEY